MRSSDAVSAALLTLLCLRGLYAADVSRQEVAFCEDVKKPFFRKVAMRDGRAQFLPDRAGAAAAPFIMPKPAGRKRIFVVGESAAQLLGAPEFAGAEVINCGMGGYESSRIEKVLGEVLSYEPDLVVVLSGNNEGPEYPCPGAAGELRRRGGRLRERLYSLVPSDTPASVRASLKRHAARLEDMAALAAGKKVPLAFCTLPINLEMPPPGSLPLESEALAAGLYRFEKKDFPGAETEFTRAVSEDKTDLHARYWLGRAQAARGRGAEAAGNLRKVPELDPAQGRASGARNELIRRTAARHAAAVCDLEGLFLSSAPSVLPGFGQFADGVHWRGAYNEAVWREIGKAAGLEFFSKASLPKPAAVPEGELRKTFSYAVSGMDPETAYGLDPRVLRLGYLNEPALAELAFIEAQSPGLAEKLAASAERFSVYFIRNSWSEGTAGRLGGLRPAFTAHLAELARRRGDHGKALSLIDPVIRLEPGKILYRLIKSQALHGLGRSEEASRELALLCAVPALKEKAVSVARARGLELPAWTRSAQEAALAAAASKKISDEGVGRARAGDIKGAAALLTKAAAVYPANAEARLSLCSLGLAGGDRRAALEECALAAAAAAAYPEGARAAMTADAAYMEGRILAALKDPAAAGRVAAALERAPRDWGRRGEASALLDSLRGRAGGEP